MGDFYPPASFRWVEGYEGRLAGSAKPYHRREIDWLIDTGIKAIVSLAPLSEDVECYLAEREMDHLNLLVPDFDIPSDKQLAKYLEYMGTQDANNRPVLVHCGAGHGRTGTMLAAVLIRQGLPIHDAIDRTGGHPETNQQMAFLEDLFRP